MQSRTAIFLAGIFLFFLSAFPIRTFAASLYFSPDAKSLIVGQTFTVAVEASSPDQAMNAASGDVNYPADILKVISISKADSVLSLWVQDPSFTTVGDVGDVNFGGIVLNPGFTGSSGNLITITFRAIAAGSADLSVNNGSILANDGSGTNILTDLESASFTVVSNASLPAPVAQNPDVPGAPIITSRTHPDPNGWYSTTTLQLAWTLPPGVDGVGYVLYSNPNFILPSVSNGLVSSVSYNLSGYREGRWYFYAKFHSAAGWGPTAIRSVNIDFTPPAPFSITPASSSDPTDPRPGFNWTTTDAVSGVAKYLVKIGDGDWFDASAIAASGTPGRYLLPLQAPQDGTVLTVDAYDAAGNVVEATTTFSIDPLPTPYIVSYANRIASSHPSFFVQGSVPKSPVIRPMTVTITLRKDTETVVYAVPVDPNGNWSFSENVDLAAGSWSLTAQASDDRGALSFPSQPVSVTVGGWLSDMLDMLIAWGAIAIAAILLFAAIAAVGYLVVHYLRRRQIFLSRQLMEERKELRDDLVRIQRELESDLAGQRIDIGDASVPKRQEYIRDEIKHIASDLEKYDNDRHSEGDRA